LCNNHGVIAKAHYYDCVGDGSDQNRSWTDGLQPRRGNSGWRGMCAVCVKRLKSFLLSWIWCVTCQMLCWSRGYT